MDRLRNIISDIFPCCSSATHTVAVDESKLIVRNIKVAECVHHCYVGKRWDGEVLAWRECLEITLTKIQMESYTDRMNSPGDRFSTRIPESRDWKRCGENLQAEPSADQMSIFSTQQ